MTNHPQNLIELDQKIEQFITNSNLFENIKPSQASPRQTKALQENLRATLIACMMNIITKQPQFLIKQVSFAGHLIFLLTENVHNVPNAKTLTNSHLLKDYLDGYATGFNELDVHKLSAGYDPMNNTLTITTDIPSVA